MRKPGFIMAIVIVVGCFLFPVLGAAVEMLNGDGSMDTSAQVNTWTLVDVTDTSAWSLDSASFQAGTGSGRLDSPAGADVTFNSYVYYRFATAKVPTAATLDLAYKKTFAGAQPAAGNWDVAAEIWEVGGSSPLQTINIDSGNTNAEFTVIPTQNLTGITKINTQYELRLVQKGQSGNDPGANMTAWFDEVKLDITYDSTSPQVVSASAPTDRSVDVVFDEPVDLLTAETVSNYSITPALNITGAVLRADGKTVRLTVDVQTKGQNYTVTVNNVRDISANAMTTAGTAAFTGVDTTPPAVVSATPVTDTTVNIRFNEPIEAATAETPANYAISPALVVTAVVLQADGVTVQLTTAVQADGTGYTVTVANVHDLSSNAISDSNTASFTGIDTTPPQVVSASTVNDTTVDILFNEPVNSETAQDAANYGISPALAVSNAVLQADGRTVRLTTARQSWQTTYNVTVSIVTDTSGNVISGSNTASFSGVDTTAPRVVSATPVNETTVDVLFSEGVDAATSQIPANYSLSPGLAVSGVVLQADGETVRLTTSIQTFNTNYTVAVTNVHDLAGNTISANNTATFTGVDTAAPSVTAGTALDYRTIDITFSEKVDAASAQNSANYTIIPALAVNGAVLQPDGVTVRLTTDPQTGGTIYTVTVTEVKDIAGNAIGANNLVDIAGVSPPTTTAPKVLSASAPVNTAAAVVFSATMDPVTAQNPANYSIFPALSVTGAILQEDGITVRLSTATQVSGTVYTVTVSNVKDQYGNVIGSTDNTASFTGSALAATNPHGRYVSDTNQCANCHITHNAMGVGLLSQPTQTQLCYLCHDAAGQSRYDVADQFGQTSPYATSHHKVPESAQQCSDCHNPHDGGKDAEGGDVHWPRLLQSSADSTSNGGNQFCFSCHQTAQGTTGSLSPALYPADGAGHNNASFIINGVTPFNPASGTNIRCMGCHERHGSGQVELLRQNPNNDNVTVTGNDRSFCYECHAGASADGRYAGKSVYDNSFYNPHALSSSISTNAAYPGSTPGQAGQCLNCHDAHGTANGTSKVLMKTLRGTYNDGKTSYTATDFTFCFGCHNSTSANSKYDIQTRYNASNGGHIIETAGGNLAAGSKLPCEACHSLHGSANQNKYMMKDSLGANLGDGRNECLACHQNGKTVEGIVMSAPTSVIPEHTGTSVPCLTCHGSPHLITNP